MSDKTTTQIVFEFEDEELAEAFCAWYLDCAGDQSFAQVTEMHHHGKSPYTETFTRSTGVGTHAYLEIRWSKEEEEGGEEG